MDVFFNMFEVPLDSTNPKWASEGVFIAQKLQRAVPPFAREKHSSTGWVDTLLVVTRSSETTLFYHKAISPFLPHHLLLALLHRYIHLMPVMSSSVEGITPNAKPFAAKHALCMIKWCFVGSSDTERPDHSMLKTFPHLIIIAILHCTYAFILYTVGSSNTLLHTFTCPTHINCHLFYLWILVISTVNWTSWIWFRLYP